MKKMIVIVLAVCITALLSSCAFSYVGNPNSTDTDILAEKDTEFPKDTIIEAPQKEYLDLNDYEGNVYTAPLICFLLADDLNFEEGETVDVDDLMQYYTICEMRDDLGIYKESLIQYKTENQNEYCIPKNIVNDAITKHFSVKIDDNNSAYTAPDAEDCYLLTAYARGFGTIAMNNVSEIDGVITGTFIYADSFTGEIHSKKEVCFKETSAEDFYIYYVKNAG